MASEAQDPTAKATPESTEGAAAAAATDGGVAKLNEEKRELNDRLLRLAAEFENYKRRTRKEMDDAGLRGMESLLKELLPVLDNMDRALGAAKSANAPGAASLIEGVQLVQKQMFSALEKFQVKSFDAEGKPFDPQFHEAIQQVDSDTLPAGTVAMVFQRGYTAGGRLLRPAMVSVVRGRASAEPAGDKGALN